MPPLADPDTPVAVVGAGCVLPPTSTSLRAYRRNLLEGTSGISPIPRDRWDREHYHSDDRQARERTYCTVGGFVDDYQFDPTPYALGPEQLRWVARANRTQQFAIDAVLQALQGARIDQDQLRGTRAALYLGNMLGDEELADFSMRQRADRHQARLMRLLGAPRGSAPQAWSAAWEHAADQRFGPSHPAPSRVLASALAPTIAAAVGVTGGAVLVDGACASGLLVVDVAVSALLGSDLDIVVAVGAMANMGVAGNVSFAKIGGLSPHGSHPLSATADGLIPGEGAGAVILKRLDRALADGDPVLGVIRGVATRSDGAGKAIYAPSSRGQVAAMRAALEQAGLTARDLDYVEVHATGTPTGDATEIESVGQLLSSDDRREPLTIGSGKALIGHGFPSAGIANLVKILLSFEEGRFFPTFGIEGPNDALAGRIEALRYLPEGGEWTAPSERPRRAMANAFGFGGVDSCVVVEQFDRTYHSQLVARATSPALPPSEQDAWLAVVGASVLLPGLPATAGLPQPGELAQAWAALEGAASCRAEDFRFPFRDVKIPPSTLHQTDRAQQLFLATSVQALRGAGLLPGRTVAHPDRLATVVATASGSEASLQRNERIRADEFTLLLEDAGAACGLPASALQGWRAALEEAFAAGPDATTEAALPGYMDNIVAGRVGNSLDLRGTNYVVDTDLSSFGAAVEAAAAILRAGDADAVLIGGVNAAVAPELADAWSRQLGAPVRPVEASVSLVVRRLTGVTDTDPALGYLRASPGHATATPPTVGLTALGADGALWAVRHLAALATDSQAEGDTIELRSAFQDAAHRVSVSRTPSLSEPRRSGLPASTTEPSPPRQPVIVEGQNRDDLLAQLETADPPHVSEPVTSGGLRLVFDPGDGDLAARRRHVAAALQGA